MKALFSVSVTPQALARTFLQEHEEPHASISSALVRVCNGSFNSTVQDSGCKFTTQRFEISGVGCLLKQG